MFLLKQSSSLVKMREHLTFCLPYITINTAAYTFKLVQSGCHINITAQPCEIT